MEKVEDFLKRKKWMQHFMADRVINTLGDKGADQSIISKWSRQGFAITAEGWIINPKQTCRLIEKHWPCNETGGADEAAKA